MLDLQPRVHFQEVKASVSVHQHLDGRQGSVAKAAEETSQAHAEVARRTFVHERRRRLLDHLLMAPLHRTIAVMEAQRAAHSVSDDLELDMPGFSEPALEEHRAIAEEALGEAPRLGKRVRELIRAIDTLHPDAAAPRRRLDQKRIADRLRKRLGVPIVRKWSARRQRREASLDHHLPRTGLVAERGDMLGSGPMKVKPASTTLRAKPALSDRNP